MAMRTFILDAGSFGPVFMFWWLTRDTVSFGEFVIIKRKNSYSDNTHQHKQSLFFVKPIYTSCRSTRKGLVLFDQNRLYLLNGSRQKTFYKPKNWDYDIYIDKIVAMHDDVLLTKLRHQLA